MLTAEDLLAAGFKEFKDSFKNATRCFQKRVWTDSPREDQTAYFINVYYYEIDIPGTGLRTSWELDMAFDRDSYAFPYCWINYRIEPFASVEFIEKMARDIFTSNNGEPYGD